jgi:hypothetical protein
MNSIQKKIKKNILIYTSKRYVNLPKNQKINLKI